MKPVSVAEHNNHQPRLHSPTPASATKISIPISSSEAALFGKGRYKVWALAAIALLALWSMFAASVTLRLSSVDLATTFGDASDPLIDELDPLEMEQREKLVRRMWDVYTRTDNHVRLPRFWQEAFEAAYEELAGDDTLTTDAAISEIARMSIHRPEVEQSSNKD
ncbi:hypothetical protein Zm00014a_037152 [Zea mays]|uniref:Uncharacterized protein n=4 Tax=Zea mays TaxID=4577 RepID=C0PBL3_MAIZE|nr:uncharacterized protein LOC100276045 [Zea mays]XP_020403174.1 uncharacterized protein LOC100276045 isoform X1 [Zea mays]ACN31558.1 unknown [Zea mays]ONM25166.1 hypothetical protein ZEAMMB73_Zm00001d006808 [Zea mays]ONM25167.1 hypothetical protein ZEAMMB73_Zm00001d006808 [Zea mays]PWZ40770.1 hypothetical protein Zm00014a_037152 [Zea mays]|eukprot:NP_001316393.1 uncharacterized protein LOC100276045 [Zea mays]